MTDPRVFEWPETALRRAQRLVVQAAQEIVLKSIEIEVLRLRGSDTTEAAARLEELVGAARAASEHLESVQQAPAKADSVN